MVRPPAPVSNREAADLLGGPGPAAVGRDNVANLGGPAGNRAVAQWLGSSSGTGVSAAPAPGATQASPVQQKQPAPNPGAQHTTTPAKAVEPPPIDWIESLPGHIKQQIDNFTPDQEKAAGQGDQRLAEAQARNRVTFMRTMRWAMGDDDAVIQKHFQDIAPIDVGDGDELWAHSSVRDRLATVKTELEAQGIPMPKTTVGLGMRGDHLSRGTKGRTWFTHAVGFAVDWRAYQTPRITDERLIKLFEIVTGGRPDMKASVESDTRIDLEIKMGQGTADPAESKKLLDSVDAEYTRLTEASDKFKTDLPDETLDRLRELEQARYAVITAQRALARLAARKKPKATKDEIDAAKKAITDAQEHYDKVRTAIVPDLPKLFEPWTKKIDERIDAIDRHFAQAGIDEEQLTSDFGLKAKVAKAAALKDADARKKAFEDIAARRKYREDKAAELGGGTDKASLAKGRKQVQELIDEKFQLITLRGMKDGLMNNTNGFVFRGKLATDDPAIDQLLGLMPENRGGFFTPDQEGGSSDAASGKFSGQHGYGLAFIKAMVSHGFEAGMAWRGGSDPMHFELAEGRKFLKTAGQSPAPR